MHFDGRRMSTTFRIITTVNKPCWNYCLNEPHAVTKNQLAKAFAYQRIVDKNLNDMLQFIGRRGLARHHRRIAYLFDVAGEFSRSKAHLIEALSLTAQTLRYFF